VKSRVSGLCRGLKPVVRVSVRARALQLCAGEREDDARSVPPAYSLQYSSYVLLCFKFCFSRARAYHWHAPVLECCCPGQSLMITAIVKFLGVETGFAECGSYGVLLCSARGRRCLLPLFMGFEIFDVMCILYIIVAPMRMRFCVCQSKLKTVLLILCYGQECVITLDFRVLG